MAARRPRLSSYERAGRASRAQMLAVEAEASRQLAEAYAAMRDRLQPHLDAFIEAYGKELARVKAAAEAAGDDPHEAKVSPLWLHKPSGGNWQRLNALRAHEARQFWAQARDIIRAAMGQAAAIGADGAQAMMREAIAPIAHLLPNDGEDLFTRPGEQRQPIRSRGLHHVQR